jgi:hypothetical protein
MYDDDDHWPDVHRDDADPPDPIGDDEDNSRPTPWDEHPSLSAEDRNARFHCQ